MDLVKVLHMNGGVGKTSYAENSSIQKKASDMVKHIIIETIEELYLATTPKSIGIADLGCSSGPNTLSIIKDIFGAIQGVCNKIMMQNPSEFRVYLNDLPTNDFNSIFKALPEFHRLLRQDSKIKNGFPSIFIGAYPGSFYGRLFPNNYLHFVYSSNSLHWLSRVPPALYDEQEKPLNKGSIYISESSPEVVTQAYLEQFKEDFSLFLRSRSEELVVDGRMVLIFLGRRGQEHVDRGNTTFFWQLLSRSFDVLISQGEIKQEKLDSYDMPFYAPSREEIEEEVRKEGLLKLERLEMFDMDTFPQGVAESYGTMVAMGARATQESLISNHFGEKILDNLFENYARLVDEEMAKEDTKPIITYFALVLRKI